MASRALKKQMRSYLVENLDDSEEVVRLETREFLEGTKTDIVRVGEDGIVVLMDKEYSDEKVRALNQIFKEEHSAGKLSYVFLKDGRDYFRTAENMFCMFYLARDGSLRRKSDKPEQVILPSPAERFVLEGTAGVLQYFRPKSENCAEGLESCRLNDFSYSRGSTWKKSKKLKMWVKEKEMSGPLVLQGNVLLEAGHDDGSNTRSLPAINERRVS